MDSSNPYISTPNPTMSPSNASSISSSSLTRETLHFVVNNDVAFPFKGSHHHHHQHEGVLGNALNDIGNDNGNGDGFGSMEESGFFDEDMFAKYFDVDMMGCVRGRGEEEGEKLVVVVETSDGGREKENVRPVGMQQHQHSHGGFCLKKMIHTDELAQLWITDPKRAKRIQANRQSAARSKERKARYIAALEKRLVTVEKEVRILAARLSMSQRDAAGLTAENTEVRLQLETMARQAQLCADLNEALKREVERLRLATGEIRSARAETFKYLGRHHKPHSSTIISTAPIEPHDIQLLPLFHTSPSTTTTRPHNGNAPGCLQGLDNINRGCLLENQWASALASEDGNSQEPMINVCRREYLVRVASPSISDTASDSTSATF